MATFEFTGLDKYLSQLDELGEKVNGLCKRALYDGAAVVANAVREEVQGLVTTDRNAKDGDPQLPFEYEKDGLLESLGIAKMSEENGYISTQIWFDGYNRMKSKKYPKGHPNMMVARAINSGTSKRPKNPFMNRAVKKAKAKAEAAMDARLSADIEQIMVK